MIVVVLLTIGTHLSLSAQEKIDPGPFAERILGQAQTVAGNFSNWEFTSVKSELDPDFFEYFVRPGALDTFFMDANEMAYEGGISFGFTMESQTKLVKDSANYYCMFKTKVDALIKKETITFDGFVIGHSIDSGKTWKFIPVLPDGIHTKEFVGKMAELGIVIPVEE